MGMVHVGQQQVSLSWWEHATGEMQLVDAKPVFLRSLHLTSKGLFKSKLQTLCISTPKQFPWKLFLILKLFSCNSKVFFVLFKPSAGGCRDSTRSRKWASFLATPPHSVGDLFCGVWMWFHVVCFSVFECLYLSFSLCHHWCNTEVHWLGGNTGFSLLGEWCAGWNEFLNPGDSSYTASPIARLLLQISLGVAHWCLRDRVLARLFSLLSQWW